MAWPNENNSLRKSSRPLSIITENPDDVRGQSKTHGDVIMKKNSVDELRSRGSSTISFPKPTRRKAVAPLQHPVDFLLSHSKENQTMNEYHMEKISTQTNGHKEIKSSTGEVTFPEINGNGQCLDCESKGYLNHDVNRYHYMEDQFSDADDANEVFVGNFFPSSHNCAGYLCNRSEMSLSGHQCISRILGNGDIKERDENGNENMTNGFTNKRDSFSETGHKNSFNTQHSQCEERMLSDSASSDENASSSLFYLSNSSTSLNRDDEDEVERKDQYEWENESLPDGQFEKIARENSTDKNNEGDVDDEQIAWKNRVKKSRSFIKINNPQRPMRRSISATFSSSGISDSSDNSLNENNSYSLGMLRRFYSQQIDSSDDKEEFQKSKPFISSIKNGFDKSSNFFLQRYSNLQHRNDPSNSREDVCADNQSNDTPIRRISAVDQSDFSLLKVTANRLHLQTRRPSVMAWKEKYLTKTFPQKSLESPMEHIEESRIGNTEWSGENVDRINASLSMLRKELISLRLQDQSLARQFLGLRQAMNSLRLTLQCKDHKELLDDAEEDIEELRELSQLVDLPPELLSPVSSLQSLGITRMNLSSRRFSTC